MTTPVLRRLVLVLAVSALALTASACGGSDDGADESSGTIEIDSVDDVTGALGADDAPSDVGLGTIAYALASVLGGEYELENETTIRLLLEGEFESNSVAACAIAGGVVEPGTTVIVEYRDGEMTCAP